MTPLIHLASPDSATDVEALAALRFAWRHGDGESGDLQSFGPAFGAWWRAHATSHLGFLAYVDGAAVGMVFLGMIDRIPGPEKFYRRAGMIQSAYVLPAARGHGIGTALVSRAIQTARDRGLAYLVVHPSERSYPLYERAGFGQTRSVLELGLSEPRRPV